MEGARADVHLRAVASAREEQAHLRLLGRNDEDVELKPAWFWFRWYRTPELLIDHYPFCYRTRELSIHSPLVQYPLSYRLIPPFVTVPLSYRFIPHC